MKPTDKVGKVAAGLCAKIPGAFLRSVAAGITIPYYHIVSDADVPYVRHLYKYKSVTEFKADLDYLLKRYTPIQLADVVEVIKSGRRPPRNALLLTFDDGFREMSEVVAPILRAKGISAVFFVNSAFMDNRHFCYLNKASLVVDRYLQRQTASLTRELTKRLAAQGIRSTDVPSGVLSITYAQRALVDDLAATLDLDVAAYLATERPYLSADQIRGLINSGFSIGAHSVDHPRYAALSLDNQLRQTIESVSAIRKMFKLNYGAFSFPHSDRDVTREFFTKVSATGLLDVSFGTAGFVHDCIASHLQRFSLEDGPAPQIVAYHQVRRMVKTITGSVTITRQ